MAEENAYWLQVTQPTPQQLQPVDASCDVVIVGAGYTGISAAIELATAGKSVQVFDIAYAGAGGSSLNGGILSGNLRLSLQASIKAYGKTRAYQMYQEGIDARHAIRDFIQTHSIDCDLQYNGRFTGTMTPADFQRMKQTAQFEQDALGVPTHILDRNQQSNMIGSDLYHGGIGRDDIGSVNPAKLFQGMLQVARSVGVRIHEHTTVTSTSIKTGVQTTRGTVRCGHILVATNAYGGHDSWLRRRIVPVISRIIATDEIPADVMKRLMPRMGTFGEARYLGRYYRPSPDGKRILMGGRDVLIGKNPDGAAQRLAKGVSDIFPDLQGIGVHSHWSGCVAFSRDELPSLFERSGILYACGYCGSGTVWAPWLGAKAAYRILGDDRAQTAFACDPPQAIPFYNGRPWFLPFAISYYGARDWLAGR